MSRCGIDNCEMPFNINAWALLGNYLGHSHKCESGQLFTKPSQLRVHQDPIETHVNYNTHI